LPCYIIAECGINHNGDMRTVRSMISAAAECGVDAVKFQKRTVHKVYSEAELLRPRESPFGTTNGDLKRGLELGREEYEEIVDLCRIKGMHCLASAWDADSVEFLESINVPCHKVPSACITDADLLDAMCRTRKPILLSTGMSTRSEVLSALEFIGTYAVAVAILHCVSTYPSQDDELNLSCLGGSGWLGCTFGDYVLGYSGHELGIATTVAAVALGAKIVERHLTLSRAMWGTDQAASLEPQGFRRMVRDIRAVESAMGDGRKVLLESEVPIKAKLRRVAQL
jgi:N-acetylneuraminate synthase